MRSNLAIILLMGVFGQACTKKSQERAPVIPEKPALAVLKSQHPDAAAAPALKDKPDALPPLTPFSNGKRVRIKPLEDGILALEITVPKNFKLSYEGGEEIPPSANFTGLDLDIKIGPPEAGFFTLKERMEIAMNSAKPPTFIRAEETEEGFLLMDRDVLYEDHFVYTAMVAYPNLKVVCFAGMIETAAKADLAASICLSLCAASPK